MNLTLQHGAKTGCIVETQQYWVRRDVARYVSTYMLKNADLKSHTFKLKVIRDNITGVCIPFNGIGGN